MYIGDELVSTHACKRVGGRYVNLGELFDRGFAQFGICEMPFVSFEQESSVCLMWYERESKLLPGSPPFWPILRHNIQILGTVAGSLPNLHGFDDAVRDVLFQVNPGAVDRCIFLPPRALRADLCAPIQNLPRQ
jgi:hypothetical protein